MAVPTPRDSRRTLVALAGCQSGATSRLEVSSAPSPLNVIPSLTTVDGGQVVRLTAKVRNEDGSYFETPDVTWSSRHHRRGEVRVGPAGGGRDFPLEALGAERRAQLGMQHLHGHPSVQREVLGQVHVAMPPSLSSRSIA